MIKVGFILEGHEWLGGVNYYRNLFSAINLVKNRKIQPILFMGQKTPKSIEKQFIYTRVVRLSLLDSDSVSGIFRRVIRRLFAGNDLVVYAILRCYQIQFLSHFSGKIPINLKIKKIGWIPDFQYLHFPEFFSIEDRKMRVASVNALISNSNWVILSSKEAMKDLVTSYPHALEYSSVLSFVPEMNLENFSHNDLDNFKSKYNITGPYFYVPNQFWIHKNHEILIRALEYLKKNGMKVTILLTGSNRDHRFPDHYEFLMGLVKDLGLREFFKPLGIVPYRDLELLMRNCVAVINPSFFEGWSTTVEEAKVLNKRILLSDIPVHREQNPTKGIYFDPFNPLDLANKLIDELKDDFALKLEHNFEYKKRYLRKRIAFGLNYQKIILDLCA